MDIGGIHMNETEKISELMRSVLDDFIQSLSKDLPLGLGEDLPEGISHENITEAVQMIGMPLFEPMLVAFSKGDINIGATSETIEYVDSLTSQIDAAHLKRLRQIRRQQALRDKDTMEVQ